MTRLPAVARWRRPSPTSWRAARRVRCGAGLLARRQGDRLNRVQKKLIANPGLKTTLPAPRWRTWALAACLRARGKKTESQRPSSLCAAPDAGAQIGLTPGRLQTLSNVGQPSVSSRPRSALASHLPRLCCAVNRCNPNRLMQFPQAAAEETRRAEARLWIARADRPAHRAAPATRMVDPFLC